MGDDFRSYEVAFLVKSPEEEKVVADLINQHKGNILQKSQIKETKLAYPIKKHSSAYFGYMHFELLPADLERLSNSLKLNPAVLRYLTVLAPAVKKPSERKSAEKENKEVPAPAVTASRSILTNEALEEKLEEILK